MCKYKYPSHFFKENLYKYQIRDNQTETIYKMTHLLTKTNFFSHDTKIKKMLDFFNETSYIDNQQIDTFINKDYNFFYEY